MRDAAVDADNVSAQVAYAYALRGIGRAADARHRIDAVLEFDTTNSRALPLRAELALATRDLNQALADAQLYASVSPGAARAALLVAQVQAARGNRTLADQSYARAMDNFPHSATIATANRDYLMATGRPAEAVALAARFLRDHPASTSARALFDQSCKRAGRAACEAGMRAP